MAEQIMSSADVASGINSANQDVLRNLVALARVSAGDISLTTTNGDVTFVGGATTDESLNLQIVQTGNGTADIYADGVLVAKAKGSGNNYTIDVQAGGLVQLQFKIDQIMASIQEAIKNVGKVSSTREGAARA